MSNLKHYSIRVSGRVQGVFYRASTVEKARQLGLRGFVRNEPDGSVYIEAEGEPDVLAKFVDWTKTGPPRARVDSCEVFEGSVKGFKAFEIQR
jgi:acylphosphatase